jgi:hypothetical protein
MPGLEPGIHDFSGHPKKEAVDARFRGHDD